MSVGYLKTEDHASYWIMGDFQWASGINTPVLPKINQIKPQKWMATLDPTRIQPVSNPYPTRILPVCI